MQRRAAIIGAGLGGLATAIRLQRDGWQVTVLEKNDRPGGRCNVLCDGGYVFDTGPTLLLMRDVLDDLFSAADRHLEDYLDLVRVHPNYRIQFADGSEVEFSGDRNRMGATLEAIEPGASSALARYLKDAGYKYRVSRDRFVERNFYRWNEFVTLTNLFYVWKTNTLRKLDRHARRYFSDPRLIAAVTFQTMYLGMAPGDAPAIYSLLPYTEIEEGIWFPLGGMYRVVQALVSVATELGVVIRTRNPVTGIRYEGRRVTAVETAKGEDVLADLVVSNADLPWAYRHLVPEPARGGYSPRRLDRMDYGSSAYLMYLGVDRQYSQLHHHNVFLSEDIQGNFDSIFQRRDLPSDPSFYVNVPNRTDPTLAPEGHDSMYVLVPVPRLSDAVEWRSEEPLFRARMYERLERVGLKDLRQHVVVEHTYTPWDFQQDYNLLNGSAFGLSHKFWQVGYMRPSNRARGLDNLYFVGASTAPGGGVPMVILGSRLVAERVRREQNNAQ